MPLLLAVLLLAQWIAQAHAYAHLHAGQDGNGAATGGRLCAACCLAAPLGHAVSAAPPAVLSCAPVAQRPAVARAGARAESFEYRGFRSRAPPPAL